MSREQSCTKRSVVGHSDAILWRSNANLRVVSSPAAQVAVILSPFASTTYQAAAVFLHCLAEDLSRRAVADIEVERMRVVGDLHRAIPAPRQSDPRRLELGAVDHRGMGEVARPARCARVVAVRDRVPLEIEQVESMSGAVDQDAAET